MKRYSIIRSFCVLVTLSWCMISCDGFLKESPRDALPEEEGYRNITELYLNAVASLYNYIGGNSDSQGLQGTGRGIYDLNTFTTDEAIMPTRGGDWYDGGFWQGLFLHKWGINNDAIQATWEYLYKVVMLSNKSLEQIESYALTHADAELPAYRAEVRALRAMYYYYLTDLFGSIPLVLSSKVASKDIILSEREDIFNFIFKELQEATPLLPAQFSNRSGNYYGRLTRPVAYFLLAKLALNAEIYMDNNWVDDTHPDGKTIFFDVDGNTFNAWQSVEFYCDQITALGYRLESDYAANFAVYNEGSVENIFTIPMNKTLYTNQMQYLFRSRHYNHAKALGLSGENGSSATIEALQTFGYETNEQDPRFDYCYYAGTVYDLKGNVVKLDDGTALVYEPWKVKLDLSDEPYEKTAGARMKKYEIDDKAMKDGKLMENDIVLFRYADVLLMKSEAKVRDGRNGDEELNQVRTRVGAPERTATLDNLLAERQLELAWEGWRRQDLIRFGQFTRSYNGRPQLPNEESGYTIVFPIPEKIRQMNPGWEQHPGY
ncbi:MULTISPECIES: RagB/SusD family nutrient uptake outer membrane protein [Bacteroides]|uniref:RagB/SusD family nutrient uptake outer membrane protein n=1 Tax=Bacteroides TaxID=816 RepID=UPI001C3755DB|nr:MULTISPECIES: RagB/SusD family nutrient uptake outer membrane protein [Bacteroides]MBV3636831.1 RagB/SusD family nutrient uptake outer membrane protein [Bacteroides cellulosilyticus]MBV3663146.1 RagB/SusD family nutrient uptake outer membrane protein [Bacteroides cellulosilyticus]MBV3685267.1 RagB/SusD family nutrient uptake outer membrane protein [Bacteroides cellulosilyticus]MBV3693833.1 RagB/SusD family nutrient uptake outer membrane protein [Bacteroides cellulosilyticus]MBV3707320.1 Rag